jgi:hypothetical protein
MIMSHAGTPILTWIGTAWIQVDLTVCTREVSMTFTGVAVNEISTCPLVLAWPREAVIILILTVVTIVVWGTSQV